MWHKCGANEPDVAQNGGKWRKMAQNDLNQKKRQINCFTIHQMSKWSRKYDISSDVAQMWQGLGKQSVC